MNEEPAAAPPTPTTPAIAFAGWDVFISYSRSTSLVRARWLKQALTARGLRVFLDEAALVPGERWLEGIEQALGSCRSFVVLLGPEGLIRWVGGETSIALARHYSAHTDADRLRIVPVLMDDTAPEVMRTFLAQFQSLRWPSDLGVAPADLLNLLAAPQAWTRPAQRYEGCPYRGLAAFQASDAAVFFGRERDTLRVLERLGDATPQRPGEAEAGGTPTTFASGRHLRWLSIIGGSGTGKSSLMRAGLLPLVAAGALSARTGIDDWAIAGPLLPGTDPLMELAKALDAALTAPDRRDSAALLERLRDPGKRYGDDVLALWLHDRLAPVQPVQQAAGPLAEGSGLTKAAPRAVLLVVDQFEELFTLADPVARQRFDTLLAQALSAPDGRLYLLSTCRSDLAHRLTDDLPALAQRVNELSHPYHLAPMSLAGLRRAIEQPAALARLDVSDITQAVLDDARDDLAGALPLVQHALTTLWAVRQIGPSPDGRLSPGGRLTLKSFDDAGRLAGILAREADAVLDALARRSTQHRHGALELLLALSHYQPDGRHTRQHLPLDAALRVAGQGTRPNEQARGREVLDALSGQREASQAHAGLRLVTLSDEAGQARVDLIHEALLRTPAQDGAAATADKAAARVQPYWPTLVNYLVQHKDRDLLRQTLRAAAETWGDARGWFARLRLTASWGELRRFRSLGHLANAQEQSYLKRSRAPAMFTRLGLVVVTLGLMAAAGGYALAESATSALLKTDAVRHLANSVRWALTHPPLPVAIDIPLGSYTMGCVPGRDVSEGEECPESEAKREVDLAAQAGACTAFGIYEVTYDEFDHYVWSLRDRPADQRPSYPEAPGSWGGARGKHPVVNVSALDADAYTAWLSATTKETWRLPTEDEWEYAARAVHPSKPGGVEGVYWWGNESPNEHARANCNGCDSRFQGESAPVGQYAANAFGLHDTVGNVWEWTSSAYSENNRPPVKTEGADGKSVPRVLRGGSWFFSPSYARASFRFYLPVSRNVTIGFRVCRASPIGPLDHGAAER